MHVNFYLSDVGLQNSPERPQQGGNYIQFTVETAELLAANDTLAETGMDSQNA